MPDRLFTCHGVRIFECAAEGPQPRSDRDVVDWIGAAGEHDAEMVLIPAQRLGDDFFQLRTRLAGEILQKFVTYRRRVAILGDISRHLEQSAALRDFVYECNQGSQIWFVTTVEELESRLRIQDGLRKVRT